VGKARLRTRSAELAKLLNASPQPIYVLDDEQVVVFANEACLAWVGSDREEVLGLRCAYHTSPEPKGPDAVAAALCPPPDAMTGRQPEGVLADATGSRRRRARFVPVGEMPDGPVGLIVLVEPGDLPQAEAPPPPTGPQESEAAWLHERIRRFRREAAGRFRSERLLGDSPSMRRVREQIAAAAVCRANVLIFGPPGSGRQHAAGAIHYGAAGQAPAGMIPLACSVLSADLIDSTIRALVQRRSGEGPAAAGTLLLNDVDLLPAEVQDDVVGMLAGGPPGPRVIATARLPLDELVRRELYREDLAALLSTIVIELPPLVRRREDIPVVAQGLVEELNARSTKQVAGFSPEALDMLDAYPWPGNVDELARMTAEAHGRAEGVEIRPGDLPERIHLAARATAHPRRTEETIVLDELLGQIERELIARALERAKGNKTKAAKLLGLTRPRLYRRLVQLGLEEQ
jgi:DNA-binding NtrC family response regulator